MPLARQNTEKQGKKRELFKIRGGLEPRALPKCPWQGKNTEKQGEKRELFKIGGVWSLEGLNFHL